MLELGQFTVTQERHGSGRDQYMGIVSCPGLAPASVAIFAKGSGTGGTLVCLSGQQGIRPWANSTVARSVLTRLQARGMKTVEIKWSEGWLKGRKTDGPKALVCRPATVLDWIKENLHESGKFAATGNSAGAAAIGYAMSFYGVSLDLAVLTSGPVFSYVDAACSRIAPFGYRNAAAIALIDEAYGYFESAGPCALKQDDILARDNLVRGGDYRQDNVHFLFGSLDKPAIINQGMAYRRALGEAGSLEISHAVLTDVGHNLQGYPAGAEAIYRAVVAN